MTYTETTMTPENREKRYFPRVNYRAYASLMTTRKRHQVHILDLSFNGALAALIHRHDLKDGEEIVLTIDLLEEDSRRDGEKLNTIKMQGKLAHQKGHYLGIECRAAGIDNQARLRELLEKHKDSEQETERSVSKMISEYEKRR